MELCFSIIGPVTRHGRKNLHFICDTAVECERWLSYIQLMRDIAAAETRAALKK